MIILIILNKQLLAIFDIYSLYLWKSFVLRIVTWCYDCLLRIIINYLKEYNCMQSNDYYLIEMVTWNHIIMYKLLVLDRNTWNHIIVYKLLVLDRNIWNHITEKKIKRNNYAKNVIMNIQEN